MAEQQLEGVDVVVVEDDYFIAMDLERVLSQAGAHVIGPFSRAEQAREAVREHEQSPLAAVLDINISGTMIYPFAEELRGAGVPFIFATGYDASNIPTQFDAVPRLVKPVDTRRLVESLASIVRAG